LELIPAIEAEKVGRPVVSVFGSVAKFMGVTVKASNLLVVTV
jgi:hypothetical protein